MNPDKPDYIAVCTALQIDLTSFFFISDTIHNNLRAVTIAAALFLSIITLKSRLLYNSTICISAEVFSESADAVDRCGETNYNK